jgi:hypothetical protein
MIVGRRIQNAVLGSGIAMTLLTGLIGYAHTPAGRPILLWLAGAAGCPLGGHIDPADRDAAVLSARQIFKGDTPAASLGALGFTLGSSTKEDAQAWASREGIHCVDEQPTDLRCTDVPAAALGVEMPAADLLIAFDAKGRLDAVDLHTGALSADEAARLIEVRKEAIAKEAGPATSTAGVATGDWLASGPLQQVSASFHYSDRRAELSATNFGGGRVVLRETHQIL